MLGKIIHWFMSEPHNMNWYCRKCEETFWDIKNLKQCPKCNSHNIDQIESWKEKNKHDNTFIRGTNWYCSNCRQYWWLSKNVVSCPCCGKHNLQRNKNYKDGDSQ